MKSVAHLNKENWQSCLENFLIVDIAIRDPNIIYLCARKKVSADAASRLMDGDIETRIVAIYLDEPSGDNYGFQELSGMMYASVGVSRSPFPQPTGLAVSRNKDGDVWPMGSGGNGPMEYIAKGQSPGTFRLKCIDGHTYSVGGNREIYKRVAVGKWERFTTDGLIFADSIPNINNMTTSQMLDITMAMGFKDLDAFSKADMYAVGGHGDVWHFNGTRWQQMGFPSNVQLATVTCAGDGNVYISGEGGSLWVGEKSTWRLIHQGGSSVLWNDVLWFKGQLWLASDYQSRVLSGNSLRAVEHGGESVNMYGHMDAHDGLLAMASPEWVKTFDGTAWRTIVAPYLA